jgi:hypothetical protein
MVWGILAREQAGIATIFWRREAMVATALSLLWVAWPSGDARRRQALGFLVVNAAGWGMAVLTPVLVS